MQYSLRGPPARRTSGVTALALRPLLRWRMLRTRGATPGHPGVALCRDDEREVLGGLDELDLIQLAGCVLLDDAEDPLDDGFGVGAEREARPAAGLAVEAEAPRSDTDDHVGAETAIEDGAPGVAEAAATATAAGCPAQRQ